VTRRPTLSLNEWVVLALVVESPRHGYDIAAELVPAAELGEVWTMPRPLVYRALERLEALEYVVPKRRESGAGPLRTVFGPSRRGRAAVKRWLQTPVEHLRDVRSGFLAKLVVARRLGMDTRPLVHTQREALAAPLAALSQRPDPPGPVALWRHHAARATAAFLDDLEG
jgi:PadR family transcriptional regulator AphA